MNGDDPEGVPSAKSYDPKGVHLGSLHFKWRIVKLIAWFDSAHHKDYAELFRSIFSQICYFKHH